MIPRIIFTFILFSSLVFSQQIDFDSPQNIKLFADFLYCEKDYLRAIDEYEKYSVLIKNDTIEFKIAYAYLQMKDYQNALEKFSAIKSSSNFYEALKIEKLKTLFLLQNYSTFNSEVDLLVQSNTNFSNSALKLKNCSLLLSNNLPPKNIFLFPFDPKEKIKVADLYDWKENPPYKSKTLAGILSAIIPGAGKIYTGNYSDGITAFILSGLFSYLAYTNFDHNHNVRAWIFTAVGAGFYAGNIYGSIASAQIFNAKINFEFNEGVKLFLEDNNYFTPAYDFHK